MRRKKAAANTLNERGYRTRQGAEFTEATINRILRDPSGKRACPADYTSTLIKGKTRTHKPESEWVYLILLAAV